MTDELDALSESVREAVEEIDSGVVCRSPAWETIRAELIRLTARVQELERENGECRRNERDAIRRIAEQRERAETSERRLERSVQDNAEWRARTLTAEAELAALKKRIAEINERLSDVEGNEAAWMRRAKYAENRIEKAPKVKVRGKIGEVCTIHVSHDLAGERVALLKLEDGE